MRNFREALGDLHYFNASWLWILVDWVGILTEFVENILTVI
jgi:hypothetical protein